MPDANNELPTVDEYMQQLRQYDAKARRQTEAIPQIVVAGPDGTVRPSVEGMEDIISKAFNAQSEAEIRAAFGYPAAQGTAGTAGVRPNHLTVDELSEMMRSVSGTCPTPDPEYDWGGTFADYKAGDGSRKTTPEPPTRCKSAGHSLNTDVVTYRDGLIVGHCLLCDERFEIPWWPGGTAAARAEGVVLDVLEQREGVDYAKELLTSIEQIDADMEALEVAREKVELARQTLAQRLVDGT